MMKPIRWGILSTGVIAKNFASTVAKMNGETSVLAVASRTKESADAFFSAFFDNRQSAKHIGAVLRTLENSAGCNGRIKIIKRYKMYGDGIGVVKFNLKALLLDENPLPYLHRLRWEGCK